MPNVVISDASCLIVLSNIGELDLLSLLYGQVCITPEIEREFGEDLPNWIIAGKGSVKTATTRVRPSLPVPCSLFPVPCSLLFPCFLSYLDQLLLYY